MKRTLIVLLTLATMLVSGNALAAATATLDISATVIPACSFTTATDSVTLPTLDPTLGTPVSGTSSAIQIACTTGVTYNIGDDGGILNTYELDDGLGNTIVYGLTYTSTGTGTGTANPLTIDIDIPFANFETAPAGTYADTVTFSFLP
ncbi:MAG: hypothetical protein C0624_09770 [Desulfuromonas sp.]|nr:MAG: hypothetical protein C0624_09770 [Desulfuromonas sp.]